MRFQPNTNSSKLEKDSNSNCPPEEIVIIQVRGERVLSENRLEGKRQSNQRKHEGKSVKRVKKNAQERTLK